MLEKVYSFSHYTEENTDKKIEKVIDDENVMINHMILPEGTCVPEHYSNSNVYLIIVRGTMTIQLNEQPQNNYLQGQILNIPYHTKMNIQNKDKKNLEFIVVKSPNPKNYQ